MALKAATETAPAQASPRSFKPDWQPGVVWGQRLGQDDCPYMRRWVLNFGRFALRLHQWFGSDDDRAFHDHPWWFATLVVRGGYTDVSPILCSACHGRIGDGCLDCADSPYPLGTVGIRRQHLGRGLHRVAVRSANHRHTVVVDPGGCVSVLVTGPFSRKWGFWVDGRFIGVRKYFRRFGHHPCQD